MSFEESGQIIEIDGSSNGKEEHMLPVHFIPEGKKCYDWIQEDLKKNDEALDNSITSVSHIKLEDLVDDVVVDNLPTTKNDSFEPCQISKTKRTRSINSYVYTSANMGGTLSSDKQQTNSILKAAEKGNLEVLTELLSQTPLLVNSIDSDGYTALHRACYSGHAAVVSYLLSRGGNINAKTKDDWQPLHCAARWNYVEVCKVLLDNKADVNAQTKGLQTPLHFAALSEDNKKIIEMLLLHPDIKANLRNGAGDTPYDLAARNGDYAKIFEMVHDGLKI